jgi:hypothetical protein
MTFNSNMQSKHNRKCLVCGEPAHFFSPDSAPVCLKAECKQVLSRKKILNESSYKQYFSLQSAQIKGTIELVKLKKKRLAEKRNMENKENVSCWMRAMNHDHGYDPDQYPYTVVPTNSKRITRLPEHRKKLFRESLLHLINKAMPGLAQKNGPTEEDQTEKDTPHETVEDELLFEAKACSICKGGCCSIGEEHAFIKQETIFRYMSNHPDQKPEQVLEAYMAYLPDESFEESCVNHTETGCSLPRDMRSHVCNGYVCESLIKLKDLFADTPVPEGVFFISRAQNNWNKDTLDVDNSIIRTELILNQPPLNRT